LKVNENGQETTGFFSRGIEELKLPLVHVGAPTKGIAPLHHEDQVSTKNTLSPSPERLASNRVQLLLGAPTNSKSSPRASDHQDRLGVIKHQE